MNLQDIVKDVVSKHPQKLAEHLLQDKDASGFFAAAILNEYKRKVSPIQVFREVKTYLNFLKNEFIG